MREPYDAHIPPQWEQAIVLESVHCRKCGYDLRGLRASSRCPECGQRIWISVQHTVDPTASRLPSLRNPRAVGNSLLMLTVCMLLGLLLQISNNIGVVLDSVSPSGVRSWSNRLPQLNIATAAVVGVIGLIAIKVMAPPRGSEPSGAIWKDMWRLSIGLVGWLVLGVFMQEAQATTGLAGLRLNLAMHAGMVVFATVGLVGLRGVLQVIGQRSREYRRSHTGRQSVELIIVALFAALLGKAIQYLSAANIVPRSWGSPSQWLPSPAGIITWVSSFMVLIGVVYLVMNAWWIRKALRKPAPPLDQVLTMQLPPDSWLPEREE